MATPLDDQAQTRLAVASLFAALAQTLGEQSESFPPRFVAEVERRYRTMQEDEIPPTQAMEMLRLVREMIPEKP